MKSLALLILFFPMCSWATVMKKVVIEDQEYSCRPSNIKVSCTIDTDAAFLFSLAADSADAIGCLDRNSTKEEIKSCFLQRRLKAYARDLDAQMVSLDCWNKLFTRCTEIRPCDDDPTRKCGYLGIYLQTLQDLGLGTSFRAEGEAACKALKQ